MIGCSTDESSRGREVARVRAHLEGAEREVRANPIDDLSDEARGRRRAALAHLRRYIEDERYPVNRVSATPTPVFVDEGGARCAMAALLEATGHHDLVARVARTANLARVPALAADGEFSAWLRHHGLTVDEAAAIQPAYHAHIEAHLQPTVAVFASAYGGGDASGVRASVSPGARVGVRRVRSGSTDSGSSVYGSLALMAEYTRSFVVNVGSANQLGLVLQWEPDGNNSDAQWYLMGGPLAALDEDDAPGFGFGGQFGAGFSLRRRAFPLFGEVVAQGLAQHGAVLRLGVSFGAVW